MDIISDKLVTIRKRRQCFACLRIFEKGTKMQHQVNNYDGIGHVYTCETCTELVFDKFCDWCFDPVEHVFFEGCISELLNESQYKGKTPEDLLTIKQE